MRVDPAARFRRPVLVVAPHMDDELLACGGTLALLPDKAQLHVIYATDGLKSPQPVNPGDAVTPDLGQVRVQEAAAATARLGVPAANLHFLDLPDGGLQGHIGALREALLAKIAAIRPQTIFLPFRFDRHPDHLAISQILQQAHAQEQVAAQLVEYFVYYRSRLLPGGDVRGYIRSQLLLEVDTTAVADQKRAALDCYASQTTRYYAWQTRPILRPALLDEVSYSAELFVVYDEKWADTAVFTSHRRWILLANRLEPRLKDLKYQLSARLLRGRQ